MSARRRRAWRPSCSAGRASPGRRLRCGIRAWRAPCSRCRSWRSPRARCGWRCWRCRSRRTGTSCRRRSAPGWCSSRCCGCCPGRRSWWWRWSGWRCCTRPGPGIPRRSAPASSPTCSRPTSPSRAPRPAGCSAARPRCCWPAPACWRSARASRCCPPPARAPASALLRVLAAAAVITAAALVLPALAALVSPGLSRDFPSRLRRTNLLAERLCSAGHPHIGRIGRTWSPALRAPIQLMRQARYGIRTILPRVWPLASSA